MRYDKDMTKGYYWILELKNGRIVNETNVNREKVDSVKTVYWAEGGDWVHQRGIAGYRLLSVGDDIVFIISEDLLKELEYDTNL